MPDLVRYVHDPFVATGVAVLQHLTGKSPADLELSDLQAQASWLENEYRRAVWQSYLTVHFPNSGWCNANIGPAKKQEFIENVLRGYNRSAIPGRVCSYCQRRAQDLADRSKIPLLTGAATLSSGAAGIPGVPVCGYCLFATQFYPLATLKVQGRPLFWWCTDPSWHFALTRQFFEEARTFVSGASDSMPNLSWPNTRLLTIAEKALSDWTERKQDSAELPDFVGCHATNYGTGPDYNEIRLRRSVLDFIVWGAGKRAYVALVESCWGAPNKRKQTGETNRDLFWKNSFYEDLGGALVSQDYHLALKRMARRYIPKVNNIGPVPGWFELWIEFLRRLVGMSSERIDAIIAIADQIAKSSQHRKILDRMHRSRGFRDRIDAFVYAQGRICKANEACLQTEKLLKAFDVATLDDETSQDSWFVFDLMLIRIYESLPQDERQEVLSTLPENEDITTQLAETGV